MSNEQNTPVTLVTFNPRRHLLIIGMCAAEGMTFAQIAEQLGITTREFGAWRSRFEIIDETILKERKALQPIIENAHFKSALGTHEWIEETEISGVDGKGVHYHEKKTVNKRTVPNVKAQIFILKNIAPEKWKDKSEIKSEEQLTIVWNEIRNELSESERKEIKALPPVRVVGRKENENVETE